MLEFFRTARSTISLVMAVIALVSLLGPITIITTAIILTVVKYLIWPTIRDLANSALHGFLDLVLGVLGEPESTETEPEPTVNPANFDHPVVN